MPGAFDFYVDESLLRRLFNDESETKVPVAEPAKALHTTGVNGSGSLNGSGNGNGNGSNGHVSHALQDAVVPVAVLSVETETETETETPDLVEAPHAIPQAAAIPSGYWAEGDRFTAEGRLAEAIDAYTLAIEKAPESAATLHYNIGVCKVNQPDFLAAADQFMNAVEVSPDSRLFRLALAYAQLEGGLPVEASASFAHLLASGHQDDREVLAGAINADLHSNRLHEAELNGRRLLSLYPDDAKVLELVLVVQHSRHDVADIRAIAEKLLAVRPESLFALQSLMGIAIEAQDLLQASSWADRILDLAGTTQDLELLLRASSVYQANGEFEKASRAAQRVIETADVPDSIKFEALMLLGESAHKLDRNAEALAAFENAISLQPEDAVALWDLAILYEEAGKLPEAVQTLKRTIELQPDWAAESYMRLASIEIESKQFHEAAESLGRCLDIRKDWPEALFQLGSVQYRLGDFERAQDTMMRALHLKPEETSWIEELERIAVERDDALLALDCHEKLSEVQRDTPEMDYNLGVVLQMESELELAAKFYIRALEKKPDFGQALLNLGHALHGLGREEEARVCWSKAIVLDPSLAEGYFG